MARKSKSATTNETAEGVLPEAEGNVHQLPGTEAAPANELAIPPRLNKDVLPLVSMAATTIAKCSDKEIKNYCATTDFVCREVTTQFAELWKEICKTAQKNSNNGTKAAKVSLSISVVIDHSNIQIHTTSVDTGFSEKHTASGEIQEDLQQTTFALVDGNPAADEDADEDETDSGE